MAWVSAAILAWVVGAGEARAGRWIIEPGQEAVLLAMLGGSEDLAGGCRLEGASVERTIVVARYTCAGSAARMELRHPSDAPPAAPRTEAFALVVPAGEPIPTALVEALGARIRAREGAFRWTAEGRALGHSLEEAGVSRSDRVRGLMGGAAAAFAFVIAFALAVRSAPGALARFGVEEAPAAAPGSGTFAARLRRILPAIGAAMLAFALLSAAVPAPPVHPDTTRDFLMAADCLAGVPCDHGPPTSLGVVVQGALWTRFLALAGAIGIGVEGVRAAVFALHAVSTGVVLAAARRRLPDALAAWTAAAWAVLAVMISGAPLLWNPSIASLPLAIFYVALLGLTERGTLVLAAAAGAILALAVECHLLFAALVPVLIAAAAGCARRPLPAVGAALAGLAAVLVIDARTAWTVNARALASSGAWMPVALVVLLAAGAGVLARRRLGAATPGARAAIFLATAAVLPAGATVVLAPVAGGAGPWRYLAPALPATALIVALAPVSAARAIARAAGLGAAGEARAGIALGAAALAGAYRVLSAGGDGPGWSMRDAQAAAAPLYARLATYPDVRARVATRTRSLLAAMALFEPPRPALRADLAPGDALVLFKAPKAAGVPPGPWVATVDLGRSVALVGAVRPFLDRTRIRACYAPLEGAGDEGGCVDTGIGGDAPDGARETADERAYPMMRAAREAFPPALLQRFAGVHERFAVRLAPAAGPAHRIELLAEQGGWTIEEVTGAAHRGALPAAHVTVEGAAAEGTLVLGRTTPAGRDEPDRYWPPPTAEIVETDAAIADAIEAGVLR
jgi:hypothetical protein